jgi:uncharacterized protein (DUF302 family)
MNASHDDEDFIELQSALPFEATLQRLIDAIEAKGLTLFSRIDHAAMAASVGLAMRPTSVLLYGNPKGGTPVMVAVPAAALDLPLRVLIREDEAGRTQVSYHPVAPLLRAIGVAADLAESLAPAQAWIAHTIGA